MKHPKYTAKACKVKINNLRQRYKELKDRKGATGAGASKWAFFDAMDVVLANSASVNPAAYVDVMNKRKRGEVADDSEANLNEYGEEVEPEPRGRKPPPKTRGAIKRRSDPLKGLMAFLQDSETKWQSLEEKRLAAEERQQRDRTKLFELLITRLGKDEGRRYSASPHSSHRSSHRSSPRRRVSPPRRGSHPSVFEELINLDDDLI